MFNDGSSVDDETKVLRFLRALRDDPHPVYAYSDGFLKARALPQDADAALKIFEKFLEKVHKLEKL